MKKITKLLLPILACLFSLSSWGQSGEALELDGIQRCMSIPNATELNPQLDKGGFSITCWVKIPQFISDSNMRYIGKRTYPGTDNNETSGYEFFGGNSKANSFSVNLSLNEKPWGCGHAWSSGFYADTWTHLSWVYNSTEGVSKIYIDGTLTDTKTLPEFSSKTMVNDAAVLVGCGYSSSNGSLSVPGFFTTGLMDNVRFYDKALTVAEVEVDKTAVVDGSTEGLVAAYDFENVVGTRVPDISGNGHDGTLIGFPDVTVLSTITVIEPDAVQGTIAVWNGGIEVVSGAQVNSGTTLTVEAAPAEGYRLKQITVNGTPLAKGVTSFIVEGDSEIAAEFEVIPEVEYCTPTGDHHPTQTTFIKTAITTSAKVNLQYPASGEITSQPIPVFNYIEDCGFTVISGTSFTFAATGSADLKWCVAEVYIDWNGDGDFEDEGEYLGEIGTDEQGNDNVVNLTKEILVPENAVVGNSRIRIKYLDAWHSRGNDDTGGAEGQKHNSPCGWVPKAICYDFPMTIIAEKESVAVTITTPDTALGTLEVLKNGVPVNSGDTMEEGTLLTAKATPASGYQLVDILVNGVALNNVVDGEATFQVMSATTVAATFELIPEVVEYCSNFGNASGDGGRSWSNIVFSIDGATTTIPVNRGTTGGTPSNSGPILKDYTSQSISVTKGSDMTITVNGNLNWMYTFCFIDWNGDGIFDDNDENLGHLPELQSEFNSTPDGSAANRTYTVKIPENAKVGDVRLRAYVCWYEASKPVTACSITEKDNAMACDFRLNILPVDMHTVTITQPVAGGTIAVMNGDAAVNNGDEVADGTVLTVVSTPSAESFVLKSILVDDTAIEGNEVTVNKDITISAEFIDTWLVEYTSNENGTVVIETGDGKQINSGDRVEKGANLTITLTPENGYTLEKVMFDDFIDVTNSFNKEGDSYVYTHENLEMDWNMSVTFAEMTYLFTINKTGNGQVLVTNINHIDVSGDKFKAGTELLIHAIPDENYGLKSILFNEAIPDKDTSDDQLYKVVIAPQDNVLAVDFAVLHAITITQPVGGTIEVKNGEIDVNNGDKVFDGAELTITATPSAENYVLKSLMVDGEIIQGNAVTASKDLTISAEFIDTWLVEYTYNAEGGSVKVEDAEGSVINSGDRVEKGKQLTLTVTPKEGYLLEEVTANGVDITSEFFVDGSFDWSANEDLNLEVLFTKAYSFEYTVTGDGEVLVSPDYGATWITDKTMLFPGTPLMFFAYPKEHNVLKDVLLNGTSIRNQVEEMEDAPGVFLGNIITGEQDNKLEFIFELASYTLNVGTLQNGKIEVKRGDEVLADGATIKYNDVLNIKPIADADYELGTFKVNNSDKKTELDGAGSYAHTVDGDVTVEATFQKVSGIDNVGLSALSVYPNPFMNKVKVDGIEEGVWMNIYDLAGNCVFSKIAASASENLDLSVLNSGSYILRVTTNDTTRSIKIVKK